MVKPNILILHCDQLRYDALGCTGHPGNPTPNIDALANKGLRFSRHFAANPVCMPSRSSFFTGMPVTAHGVWTNGVPLNRREYQPFGAYADNPFNESIPELPTIADLFSEAGYATGAFGKLHLTPTVDTPQGTFPESENRWISGEQDDWHGPYFGFDHVELTHTHGEIPGGHFESWLRRHHPETLKRARKNEREAPRPIPGLGDLYSSVLTDQTHPSFWICQQSLNWIAAQENPFCAFLGFPDPHHAFCALEEDMEYFADVEMPPPVNADGTQRGEMISCGTDVRHFTSEQHDLVRRTTAAMVRTIDRAIGVLIEGLIAAGKWDNTVVLFTSDHGDYLGDHGCLRKSHRAAVQLLRVPCILRLPSTFSSAVPRLNSATSNIDVLPTLLGLAGVDVPQQVLGSDLLSEENANSYAISHGFSGAPEEANFSIMDHRFRYTVFPASGYRELFDHQNDPLECHNLSDDPAFASDHRRLHLALGEAQLKAVNPIAGRLASW